MKIFYNSWVANHLLAPGYKAITLFTMIFFKNKKEDVKQDDLTHEMIHSKQQEELYVLGFIISVFTLLLDLKIGLITLLLLPESLFYIIYGLEYVISIFFNKFNNNKSYHTISLEEEAYDNEDNINYINERKRFAWVKYLGNVKYKK